MKTTTKFTCPTFAALAFACFTLLSTAQAVNPPPDGGYGGNNTAEGTDALFSLTSGVWNVAVGFEALFNDTSGNQNTATGYKALFSNITGDKSTAYGSQALYNNQTGNDNVATGFSTLYSNTSGSRNTGVGYRTLTFNTTGNDNTAIGWNALYLNISGNENTATGSYALYHNKCDSGNTATGFQALYSYESCGDPYPGNNTATGYQALYRNSANGVRNTANGARALFSNLWGQGNTADGFQALYYNTYGYYNTALGFSTLSQNITGNNNIALGTNAGGAVTTANSVICIGTEVAGANVSNTTWVGNVYGVPTQSGMTAPVIVSADGQLGTVVSSERFKKDIATMEKTSEAILSLRPVTFHYKTDSKGIPQFGLIAEEVAKVNPALVLPDKEGKPYTVRYDAVNAMLLNEFLKEHKAFVEAQQKMEKLETTVASLVATVNEQASQIQKVSAQLEARKPAPQVVNNP